MALRLRIVSDNAESAGEFDRWTFGVNGGRIGRAIDNDWVLFDTERYISAHHAEIEHRAGEWWICDLSTNGTFINGSHRPLGRGARHRLADGDRVRFGPYEITAQISNSNDFLPEEIDLRETALDASFNEDSLLPDQLPVGRPRPTDTPGPPRRPAAAAGQTGTSRRPAATGEPEKPARPGAPPKPPGTDERALWPGLAAFCKGAGIDPFSLPPETRTQVLHEAGQAMREMMLGLLDLSRSRAEFSREMGISGSARQRDATSPLMQVSAVEEALQRLLKAAARPQAAPWTRYARSSQRRATTSRRCSWPCARPCHPCSRASIRTNSSSNSDEVPVARPAREAQARYWARYREMYKAARARATPACRRPSSRHSPGPTRRWPRLACASQRTTTTEGGCRTRKAREGLPRSSGGEGGIRTHVGRNAPNRFRVGAVVTASVPLRGSRAGARSPVKRAR
jgi:predicted component of type VI protein secretion system